MRINEDDIELTDRSKFLGRPDKQAGYLGDKKNNEESKNCRHKWKRIKTSRQDFTNVEIVNCFTMYSNFFKLNILPLQVGSWVRVGIGINLNPNWGSVIFPHNNSAFVNEEQ